MMFSVKKYVIKQADTRNLIYINNVKEFQHLTFELVLVIRSTFVQMAFNFLSMDTHYIHYFPFIYIHCMFYYSQFQVSS